MSIKIGDMVSVINPMDRYFRRTFTVVDIDGNSYSCHCGIMYRDLYFSEVSIEKIESPPRFLPGTVVVPINNRHPFMNMAYGIIETSNRLGSMVRVWEEYVQAHRVRYVSNRNLRAK